jgi:hypothetical protein
VSQNPSYWGFRHWEAEHGEVFRLRNWRSPEDDQSHPSVGGHVEKIGDSPGFQNTRDSKDQRISVVGFAESRRPKRIGIVQAEDTWQRSRHQGNSRKKHFGISATGNVRGKSSKLLTHRIPKESEPLDQGRL